MAFEIPSHFAESFTTNVELLLQERIPVMLMGANMANYQGHKSAQVVKQFGEVEFEEKTTRNGDTNFAEIEHKQRWVFPTDFTLALPVDKEDEIKMLNSPVSPYVEAMRAAWARKANTICRDALLGSSKTGDNGGTTTAFDTTNNQIASGSTGLTITKLRSALEILRANHSLDNPGISLHFALMAEQMTDLLETTEITSSDYNTVKALVNGDVNTFLGFNFHHYESLGVDGSSDRRCIAWTSDSLTYATWNNPETNIGPRADKNYLTQVHMAFTAGATRTQEGKVVEVLCTEA